MVVVVVGVVYLRSVSCVWDAAEDGKMASVTLRRQWPLVVPKDLTSLADRGNGVWGARPRHSSSAEREGQRTRACTETRPGSPTGRRLLYVKSAGPAELVQWRKGRRSFLLPVILQRNDSSLNVITSTSSSPSCVTVSTQGTTIHALGLRHLLRIATFKLSIMRRS